MLEKRDNSFFSNVFHDVDSNTITLMRIILMKNILKLLFMLDLWFGVIDLNETKHVKKI